MQADNNSSSGIKKDIDIDTDAFFCSWVPTISCNYLFEGVVFHPKTDRSENPILPSLIYEDETCQKDVDHIPPKFFDNHKNSIELNTYRLVADTELTYLFPLSIYSSDFHKKYLHDAEYLLEFHLKASCKYFNNDNLEHLEINDNISKIFLDRRYLEIDLEFYYAGQEESKREFKSYFFDNGIIAIFSIGQQDLLVEERKRNLFEAYSFIRDTWHDHKFHNHDADKIPIISLISSNELKFEAIEGIHARLEKEFLSTQRGVDRDYISVVQAKGFSYYTESFRDKVYNPSLLLISRERGSYEGISSIGEFEKNNAQHMVESKHLDVYAELKQKISGLQDDKFDALASSAILITLTSLYMVFPENKVSRLLFSDVYINHHYIVYFVFIIVFLSLYNKSFQTKFDKLAIRHKPPSLTNGIIQHTLNVQNLGGICKVGWKDTKNKLPIPKRIYYVLLLMLRALIAYTVVIPVIPDLVASIPHPKFNIGARLLASIYRPLDKLNSQICDATE